MNRGVGGDGNPLTMAAKGGHLEAVRLLLDRGADIDRLLIERGADVNARVWTAGPGRAAGSGARRW